MKNNLTVIAVAIAVLIILFPLGYSLVWPVVSQGTEPGEPFLEVPEGSCVAEKSYMRYRHMDLLDQIRDEAVRQGKRERVGPNKREITLTNCVKCHGGREQFCNRCHTAVNLQVNCFRCHYDPGSVAQTDK